MPEWSAACGQIRQNQTSFNALFKSREDVRPEWYLATYGGLEWETLYRRVCEKLKVKPLR